MDIGATSLAGLARLRTDVRSERISSYDRAGGNYDWWVIPPSETATIAAIEGAGCVKHIWMTMWCSSDAFPRKLILRAWWDGEELPSIEAPIGDFFGLGHGLIKSFWSLPLQMSPQSRIPSTSRNPSW